MKSNRSLLIKAAMGKTACDLTISNVRYVNVFTGEIYDASVDVTDGYVVRVRTAAEESEIPSVRTIDGQGDFLIPGFIDSHMHVESTMMIPEHLSRAIVPWGTTAICTDPHEIGNVMGIDGVKFMLDNAKHSSLRQYVLAPSCVPAVPGLEHSGADFGADEIETILAMDHVIGIAELMDYVGIYNDSERMHSIIDKGIERHVFLQGHAPLLTGKELVAYKLGGPCSDHESETTEEIIEKLRLGFHINLRASSLVDHLEKLAEGIKQIPYHDFISICTDDVHAHDLLAVGHINRVAGYAISCGLDAVDVIRMATLNAAREFGFDDLGAVAPGYRADMQLVGALDGRRPRAVFIGGRLVAENGEYIAEDNLSGDHEYKNTVNIPWIRTRDDFALYGPEGAADTADVNVIVPMDKSNVLRRAEKQRLPVSNGKVCLDQREDLAYVCVCNRHGTEQKTIAVIQDFGLLKGAVGTTVSHDSHNLVVIYKNETDAFCVADRLRQEGGGMCVAQDGKVTGCMALPVAGLMSDKSCKSVAEEFEVYKKAFYQVCQPDTPLLSAAIMSLTALPGIIVTDCGLADGTTHELLSIFA